MESWRTHCPGWEIRLWDERNAPLEGNAYAGEAIQAGRWAFVSDYVRLKALWAHGGVYLDTDVELTGPLERLTGYAGFMGFESDTRIATCVIGAEPGHPAIGEMLREYESAHFLREDGEPDEMPNTARMTQMLRRHDLRLDGTRQTVCGMEIFPREVFCAKDLATGKITRTAETVAVHHFHASWMSRRQRLNTRLAQILGPERAARVKSWLGNMSENRP